MSDAQIGGGAQVAGGTAQLANGIVQGNAARHQGMYNNQISQINAKLSQMQARDAKGRGDVEASRMVSRGKDVAGAQQTSAGAGGVDPNSGSAAQSQASTGLVSALDAITISHNAALESIGYNLQGQNMLTQGRMAKIAGNNANTMDIATGGLKFGNSVMQGAANYDRYRPTVPVTMDQRHYDASPGAWGGSNESEGAAEDAQQSESPWGGSNESEQAP